MLENINYALFAAINATPTSPSWAITLATLIAKDLILIVPLLTAALWLWRPNQRQLVFKVMLALAISLTLSWIFGLLFPHERPFAADVGYQFLHHSPNNSFPSNHGTISFTFALAFLFWHRLGSGLALLAAAAAIAWSRVYLGRALADGYARRPADRHVRLPGRAAAVAQRRPSALSIPAAPVPPLFLPADPQRLGPRIARAGRLLVRRALQTRD
ncbi:Putative undecaprenyl-diphosphatase ybjG [Raoultella terrigena]|uniref:Undecaprenyl-diphosphatase ybjG n=1 Tax=Raoultella terrigena TaxID=577 RepID=A0A485B6K8_RAOTE|nr:Putative undecaprenyl-diphosphatase ybjG [Raoultella terrigena]